MLCNKCNTKPWGLPSFVLYKPMLNTDFHKAISPLHPCDISIEFQSNVFSHSLAVSCSNIVYTLFGKSTKRNMLEGYCVFPSNTYRIIACYAHITYDSMPNLVSSIRCTMLQWFDTWCTVQWISSDVREIQLNFTVSVNVTHRYI